ncbi:unnamed protein product [Symbiodinium sp. CCMP2592]|nr:unnamed protein product [Symbiodinium sp. CCMP2592]
MEQPPKSNADEASPSKLLTPGNSPATVSTSASPMKVYAGLPDYEYPSPVSVRNTFLNVEIGRPPSIDEFYQERGLRSAPGSAFGIPPGLDSGITGSQVTDEEDFVPRKENMQDNSPKATTASSQPGSTIAVTQWPRTMSGDGLEEFISLGLGVVDISGQAPSLKEMPPPPPAERAPQFVIPESLPPLPTGSRDKDAADLPVPVKLAQALQEQEPAVGSPEVPTQGSRDHRLGKCRPCAFFHTKGCANGVDCEFCHLCDSGEKKRRARQRAILRKEQELVQAASPMSVGLVPGGYPMQQMQPMGPMTMTVPPMMQLPGMWPPPL